MKSEIKTQKYLALLRGINVGGHHKVSMTSLIQCFGEMGFTQVQTVFNSGNVVFYGPVRPVADFQDYLSKQLSSRFEFPIPVLVRKMEEIVRVVNENPFRGVRAGKDLRCYVTFLHDSVPIDVHSIAGEDAFKVLSIEENMIFSILDISRTKTTDAMRTLEKRFGKALTTRNWDTVLKAVTV